jgi:hypothetical protein
MAIGKKTGGGSRKGKPNKITADLKAMILGALSAAGGQAYLEQQAEKNPVAFMTLIGKVLPLQVGGTDAAEPIKIQWISYAEALSGESVDRPYESVERA